MKSTKRVTEFPKNEHVKVSNEWGDFERGDPVRISGERGTMYQFIGHCRHNETGNEWLALYGGSSGVKMFKYVDPKKVRLVPGKKVR